MSDSQTTDDVLTEAIRIGCTAADVHLMCSYPTCSCKTLPKAIIVAVAHVIAQQWRNQREA